MVAFVLGNALHPLTQSTHLQLQILFTPRLSVDQKSFHLPTHLPILHMAYNFFSPRFIYPQRSSETILSINVYHPVPTGGFLSITTLLKRHITPSLSLCSNHFSSRHPSPFTTNATSRHCCMPKHILRPLPSQERQHHLRKSLLLLLLHYSLPQETKPITDSLSPCKH